MIADRQSAREKKGHEAFVPAFCVMLDPHHRGHIIPLISESRWTYVSLKHLRRSCRLEASLARRASSGDRSRR